MGTYTNITRLFHFVNRQKVKHLYIEGKITTYPLEAIWARLHSRDSKQIAFEKSNKHKEVPQFNHLLLITMIVSDKPTKNKHTCNPEQSHCLAQYISLL